MSTAGSPRPFAHLPGGPLLERTILEHAERIAVRALGDRHEETDRLEPSVLVACHVVELLPHAPVGSECESEEERLGRIELDLERVRSDRVRPNAHGSFIRLQGSQVPEESADVFVDGRVNSVREQVVRGLNECACEHLVCRHGKYHLLPFNERGNSSQFLGCPTLSAKGLLC